MSTPLPTRTEPLPVRLDAGTGQILLYVGDRKVASAWGPAVDDPDAWFLWNGYSEPYRIGGGRAGASALIEDRQREWQLRERSLWHPDHGAVDEQGWVHRAPDGAACVGCGTDLAGSTHVSVITYSSDTEITGHYVCDHCETYHENADEELTGE